MATSVKYSGWKKTPGQNYLSALHLGIEALRITKYPTTCDVHVTGVLVADGGISIANTRNIVVATGTGTKIGTATGQKIGFWNATPVVQQAHIANPSAGTTVDAEARTAINAINALCAALGLTAAS